MAKDFNIYQWRREHLNENQVSENTPSWKEEFKDIMKANNLTPGEVMDFVSIYFKDEKGKPNMIGLNEDLKIGDEYTKEEVANMFDQIYWKATNKLDKEGILALPFDKIRYFGVYPPKAYSALPNFVSPKGPDQPARTDDSWIAAAYAADKAAGIRPGLD